jgi:anaerobic sulfite reductase subunit B
MKLPHPYRVVSRRVETPDTVTLSLEPAGKAIGPWAPGQFTMVYAFGVGEVPISISGGNGRRIQHTVRDVGATTHAIVSTPVGGTLGLSGPYGRGWGLDTVDGRDLVVVAGGIGLAPLRPVVTQALADRERYGRVAVLVGARTPDDLVFTSEYAAWRGAGAQVLVTVDHADAGWRGSVGVVTGLLSRARFMSQHAVGFVCGPEVMMRFVARDLGWLGVPPESVRVSLERNMRCGVAWCGHCQLGPLLVCRDGPVMGWDRAASLLSIGEL